MAKESFVLYCDYLEPLQKLSDADAGRLFKAILQYVRDGTAPELDGPASMAFEFIRSRLDRDAAKYEQIRQQRVEAGRKGGQQKAENLANANTC